jgi:hypothetical protein
MIDTVELETFFGNRSDRALAMDVDFDLIEVKRCKQTIESLGQLRKMGALLGPHGYYCGMCNLHYEVGEEVYWLECDALGRAGTSCRNCLDDHLFKEEPDSDHSWASGDSDNERNDDSSGIHRCEGWNSPAPSPIKGGAGGEHHLSLMD